MYSIISRHHSRLVLNRCLLYAQKLLDDRIFCAYNKHMDISYDPAKNKWNIRERGLSFDQAEAFDFETAKIWQDMRKPYPDSRFIAIGYLDDRLHVLVFGETELGIRVISFRKANLKEGVKHGFSLTLD